MTASGECWIGDDEQQPTASVLNDLALIPRETAVEQSGCLAGSICTAAATTTFTATSNAYIRPGRSTEDRHAHINQSINQVTTAPTPPRRVLA